MRNFDIIGSIILTLVMMLIANALHLGLFGSIVLMLVVFLLMNNRGRVKGYLYNVGQFFVRKPKKVSMKSSYDRMDIDEL